MGVSPSSEAPGVCREREATLGQIEGRLALPSSRRPLRASNGATGVLAGSTEVLALSPGGWTQLDGILSRFGLSNGYARVVRVSGSSPFVAYGVVNDGASPGSGGTNDGSYVTASAY